MNLYIATTFYKGIGNRSVFIGANNYDEAFEKLLSYYDKRGATIAYFENGILENHADWDWFIEEAGEMEVID